MRSNYLSLLLLILSANSYAQEVLRVTSNRDGSVIEIKERDFVKCRFAIGQAGKFMGGGIVRHIDDSSLVYQSRFGGRQQIKLSSITNLDRVPFKRNIVPCIAVGLLAGGLEVAFNKRGNPTTTGLLLGGAILLELNYVYLWNNRQLNRNAIPSAVHLTVDNRR